VAFMNTKLTLHINRSVIEEAKFYAKENNKSLSKLIENYLFSLTKPFSKERKISPLVESLTGIIPDDNIDEHKEYCEYVMSKYV